MSGQIVPLVNVRTLQYRENLLMDIAQAQVRCIELAKEAYDCPWWRPGKRAKLLLELGQIRANINVGLSAYRIQFNRPAIMITRITDS